MEGMTLVTDLALIFITAGITTLIFKALKQPLILGYIVAGFLVGPHTGLLPTISDAANIEQWSEIGIIFLLFGLGLEFSFKKLLKVGSKALIMMAAIFFGMTAVGLALGKLMGWDSIECIFLGGVLSMSSTTIIIKAFEDLKIKDMPFTQVVYGELIIEDLLAVVLMVLLSTMAATKQFAGKEMVWALAKLLFFVIFWFVVGMYVIPTLFGKGRKFMNEEMLTVLSIGLCFGMVVLANIAGFSSALGAFIMGSLLSETLEGEQIEHQVKGIKDLFGAVFFVSVGMLVDPSIILQYWKPILILTVTVLLMRPLFATIGVMLGGSGLRASVRSGMSVGLVGEFGFILVSQGVALGVMREFLYPVIVAVSVITTFIAPYYMKAGEPLGIWLEKKVPSRLQRFIQPVPEVTRGKEKKNEWKRLLTMYFTRVLVYGVLLLAIWIGANHWLYDFVTGHLTGISSFWQKMVCIGVTLVVMAPFLAGMMSNTAEHRNLILRLWDDGSYNRGPLMALLILRVFAAVCIVLAVIYHYFSMSLWVLIPTALALLVLFLNIRRNIHKLNFMEAKFLRNLSEKERRERSVKPMTTSLKEMLADKDLQVENLQVSGDSPFIGQQLSQLDIRAKYHVMILKIIRGSRFINLPQANEYIYPADGLVVIGSKENIADFKAVATLSEVPSDQQKDVFMGSFVVGEKAIIAGKNLIQIGFRNSSVALIAVERGSEFYLNPDGQFVIKAGDKVWLLGDEAACHRFV